MKKSTIIITAILAVIIQTSVFIPRTTPKLYVPPFKRITFRNYTPFWTQSILPVISTGSMPISIPAKDSIDYMMTFQSPYNLMIPKAFRILDDFVPVKPIKMPVMF